MAEIINVDSFVAQLNFIAVRTGVSFEEVVGNFG